MSQQSLLERPDATEYAPYYGSYVDLVPEGDILDQLEKQIEETVSLLAPLDERRAEHRYAEGKWSIKEVIGHLIDTERVFVARTLHFARQDPAPLPGFEQDDYVAVAHFDRRPLRELLEEFDAVRRSTAALFRGLEPEAWTRRGVANAVSFTVRSFPFLIAGHELHHRQVLRERYL